MGNSSSSEPATRRAALPPPLLQRKLRLHHSDTWFGTIDRGDRRTIPPARTTHTGCDTPGNDDRPPKASLHSCVYDRRCLKRPRTTNIRIADPVISAHGAFFFPDHEAPLAASRFEQAWAPSPPRIFTPASFRNNRDLVDRPPLGGSATKTGPYPHSAAPSL